MGKKVNTHAYPCWIACDENGCINVFRSFGDNTEVFPPKPVRHRAGEKTYIRAGFITVEGPPLPEGSGRWELERKHAQCFRLRPEVGKKYFPGITWESEPMKGRMSFCIETEE